MAVPKNKTDLEDYLVYGVDPKNRRIFFGHAIDMAFDSAEFGTDQNEFATNSVELAVRAIKRLEEDHPSKPIELHMNSYGGDAEALMYLMDVILASTCQFKFYGGGRVMSCATWLMCICDERYLYPNASVMLHHGSDGVDYNQVDLEIYYEASRKFKENLTNVFTENSFMPFEFWDKILGRDVWITPEEAVKLGIADAILQRPKRGNLRKKRNAHMAKPPHHRTMEALIKNLYKRVKMDISGELKIHIPEPDPVDPNVVVDETPVTQAEYEDDENGKKEG